MEPAPIQEADVISLPKEKATLSFVKAQGDVTSWSRHFALPLLFPGQGFSPFANVTLSLTKLLDLAFLPDSTAKWKRAPGRRDQKRRGVCAAGREALFTRLAEKFSIPFSNPDAGPRGQAKFSPQTMPSALKTAHRLARQGNCGHFFLYRAGFSLMLCIKATQGG